MTAENNYAILPIERRCSFINYEIINVRKKALGITNAQLAERTGISISTLDKITSGQKQNPTLDTLQAIADQIGCSIDDFRDAPKIVFSVEASEIAQIFDSLNDAGKDLLRFTAHFAEHHHKAEADEYSPIPGSRYPVLNDEP